MLASWFCCWIRKDEDLYDEEPISFIPPITKGKVIKVYDGDTITVATKLPYRTSPLYKFSIRLAGIDCPEIRSKDKFESNLAKYARDKLKNIILGKEVVLDIKGMDKYGRCLAIVMHSGVSVNQWLIKNNLAVPYDGKTKPRTDWNTVIGSTDTLLEVLPSLS